MKFLNSGPVDKAQAGAELSITRLLGCFAAFIILPFLADSTAVPPCIPVKGSSENVPGLPRDCTWAEHTQGLAGGGWGFGTGGCSSLAVTFQASSAAGLLVLGMVGIPSQKVRWHWALLQRALEPRSCCKELWLCQKDAFGKDETVSPTRFCFSLLDLDLVCGLAWQ